MEHSIVNEIVENGSAEIAIDAKEAYISNLFLWTFIWFLVLLSFILIIDPYGVSPIQINLPGINTYKSKRLDIDRLIKPYEVWRYQPKTIFIGTSRIHQSINPSVFDNTNFAPAYNAAIPASSLAQNFDNIEQFIRLDPHIKYIFVELFLYNFTGQSQESTPKSWMEFLHNYTALQMSTDALIAAFQTIISNKKDGPIPAHIAKLGYRVHGSDFNPGNTFSEELNIKTVLSCEHNAKLSLQSNAFQSLDRIVKLAQSHGIQLHLLITPNYPWDDYRLISLGYWPLVEKWLRKMASYENVISFSQYNSYLEEKPTLTPQMKWWNDPIHFSLKMGRAMMQAFLGHPEPGTPSNLIRSLNKSTVEKLIAERRTGALRWAQNHSDYVAHFEEAKSLSGATKNV